MAERRRWQSRSRKRPSSGSRVSPRTFSTWSAAPCRRADRPGWAPPLVGHGQTDQRVGGARYHPHAPGLVERFREEGFGGTKRPTEVLGQAEVEGLVDDAVVVVQRAGDVERLEQVPAGAIQVTQRELGIPEVADHRSHLEPVPGLAVEQERFGGIASRASMVSFDVHGERPDGQEAGGQMRFPQPARQAQPFLDERQRDVLPPPAEQNIGAQIQQVGGQEAVVGGAGNGQRFLAILLGERVAPGLVEEVGRCGQGPRAQERRPRGSWCGQEGPEGVDSLRGVPSCLPEHPQGGDQLETGRGVGLSQAEGDRGPEIVELEIEKIQPRGLIVRDELRSRRLRESQIVVAMGSPRVVCRLWALAFELPGCVLPDRFQQPVPGWSGAAVVELHEVLVDQGPEVRHSLVRDG